MEIMYTCEWNLTNLYGTWKWRRDHFHHFHLHPTWNRRYSLEIIFLSFNLILFMGISWANDLDMVSKIHVGWRWKWWKWSPYQWWDCCGLVNQVVVVATWWMIIVHLFQLLYWNTSEVVFLPKVCKKPFLTKCRLLRVLLLIHDLVAYFKKTFLSLFDWKKAANQT